jgi:predicted RNA polymerase sigma factor
MTEQELLTRIKALADEAQHVDQCAWATLYLLYAVLEHHEQDAFVALMLSVSIEMLMIHAQHQSENN